MINIAIVDDDEIIQIQIKEYITTYFSQVNEKFKIITFSDGDEIIENYCATFDIIFLDVQMKRMDGMTTAEKIREIDKETILIFITNMAHYAIKGYSVDAMNFLLKPVKYFSFSQELEKVLSKIKKRSSKHIALPIEGGMVKINVNEIYYVETYEHKLRFHTKKGEYYLNDTMKNLEEQLIIYNFFRCNNCYLVNLAYVQSLNNNVITVDAHELQISRPKKNSFKAALADYIGGVLN